MNTYDLIIILVGISATTFAISLLGDAQKCLTNWNIIKTVLLFTLIPVAGLLFGHWIGLGIMSLMNGINYWILIIILFLMGIRFLLRSFRVKPDERMYNFGLFRVILGIAFALSMDTLFIGPGFAFTKMNIFTGIIILSVTGFIASLTGLIIGKKTAKYEYGSKIEFLGGLLLIGMGAKFLFQIVSLMN